VRVEQARRVGGLVRVGELVVVIGVHRFSSLRRWQRRSGHATGHASERYQRLGWPAKG
jgi:hypothetical protein